MKKSIAGVLLLLAAAAAVWVGLAWYTGGVVEQRTQALMEEANRLLEEKSGLVKLRLERSAYERSLFSTRARYALVLDRDGVSASGPVSLPVVRVEFDSHIDHGPFPAAARARGIYSPQMAAMHSELVRTQDLAPLFDLAGDKPPLVADDVLGYDGVLHSIARVSPLRMEENDKTLHFSGMEIRSTLPLSDPGNIRVQASIDELGTQDGEREHKVSDVQIESERSLGQFGLGVGNFSLRVQQASFQDEALGQVVLEGLELQSTAQENGGALAFDVAWLLGGVRVDDAALGSGEMRFRLEGLDGQTLKALAEAVQQTQRKMLEQQNPRAFADELPVFFSLAGKLLAAGPSLALDPLRWKTAAGESTLRWKMGLTATPQVLEMFDSASIPPGGDWALQVLDSMELDVRLSKPMMVELLTWQGMQAKGLEREEAASEAEEQVRTMAAMAELMALAQSQGEDLVGTFRYAEGEASLNGRPVPLQDLLRGMLPR